MLHSIVPRLIRRPATPCAAAAVLVLLGASSPASAHHAFAAEFDSDKPVRVEGVVTKIRWVNPHSWVYIDVADKDGKVVNWGFEFGTPNALARAGLGKDDVKPGERITIDGFLAKNGGPYGYSAVLTLKDGRSVRTGGAGDAPTPTAAGSARGSP